MYANWNEWIEERNAIELSSLHQKMNLMLSPAKSPKVITKKMLKLVRKVSDSKPVKLFSTNEGSFQKCYVNCERKVQDFGGRAVYGYQVYNWNGLGIELVPHAIWERPNGEWVDITPEQDLNAFSWFVESKHSWKWVPFMSTPSIDLAYPNKVSESEMNAWKNLQARLGTPIFSSISELLNLCDGYQAIYKDLLTEDPSIEKTAKRLSINSSKIIPMEWAQNYLRQSSGKRRDVINKLTSELSEAA